MKFSRPVLAILLILVLLFFVISKKGAIIAEKGGDSQEGIEQDSVEGESENRNGVTPSARRLGSKDRFGAHSINVEAGEGVFLSGRKLKGDISEIVYLSAELVVLDDGKEVVRLLRKVIHMWDGDAKQGGAAEFFQQEEDEWVVDEELQQIQFRKLAQKKGTNIMTMETKLIEIDDPFDAIVAQGDEDLCIDGVAERGRDGALRLRLGNPYTRPSE